MNQNANRLAIKITLIYILVALVWIFASDWMLKTYVHDAAGAVAVDIIKDTIFALLTAATLHQLLKRAFEHWRHETEERQRAEELYRRMFDVVTDAVFLMDCDTKVFLDANPAAVAMYGYTREEFLRLKAADISAEPDQTNQVIASGTPHVSLRFHRRKDGRRFAVEISCSDFFHSERKVHVAVIRDITERRRVETALRLSDFSVNQSSLPTFWIAPDSRIMRVNTAVCQYLGYTEAEMLQLAITELDPDFPAERWPSHWDELRSEKRMCFETRHRHKDGRIIPVEVSLNWFEFDGQEYNLAFVRDITERKQAEDRLRASEERLRLVTDNARVGLVVVNGDRRYAYANGAYAAILGLPSADIVGQRVADVLAPIYTNQVASRMDRAFSGERLSYELQKPVRGSLHYYAVTYEPIRVHGQDPKVVVVLTDITSHRLAERQIADTRSTLNAALSSMADAVLISDIYGQIIEVNDAFAAFHRFKNRFECLRAFAESPDIVEVSTSDGTSVPKELWAVSRALRGEVDTNAEYYLRRKDTGETWVGSYSFGPIRDQSGIIIGSVVVGRDITESKRSAEHLIRLATAVEQAAEAIIITDTRGVMLYVNPAFERVSGYTREEAVGKNPRILKSGRQDAGFYRQMWSTITRGEAWQGRFVNRHKNGSLFEEEATITPIRNATGRIVNFVAVKRDVTRETQLEVQFRQAQKMEAIGTLAGGIAHDFNNILAAMFGYGYLLRQDVASNTSAVESVEEILNAAGRARDLVQQILTFSRQREQKRQVVHLNCVVKEAIKFLRASLPAGIKIDLQIDPGASAALVDPSQIYQVVLNLATNAFHAMEGSNGVLAISLQDCEPAAELVQSHPGLQPMKYVRLLVADNGCGMDAKTLERIYEPFFTTKPVGKGTGLGLAVVHGIVHSHDAIMTVESQVGQGTTFAVYFPARTVADQPAAAPAHAFPKGAGQGILVVDDEKPLTNVFKKLLDRLGYQVTTSNVPQEALNLFSENPNRFDLVITDYSMPDINGVELARKLHRERPSLPILLASGFNAGIDTSKLEEAGIRAIVEKPVSVTAITETLAGIFGGNGSASGQKKSLAKNHKSQALPTLTQITQ